MRKARGLDPAAVTGLRRVEIVDLAAFAELRGRGFNAPAVSRRWSTICSGTSRSPVPGPLCCVDFSGGPSVCCQHLSRILQLSCYIPVAALFIYVFSILDLVLL